MRTLLVLLSIAATAAGCGGATNDLADPARAYRSIAGYGTLQNVHGDLLGTRPDPVSGQPAPAGVPYTEQLIELGGELEFIPDDEKSMLGTNLGMFFADRIGWLRSAEIEPASGMTTQDQSVPLSMSLTAGSLIPVLRRPGVLLALHSAIDFQPIMPDRLGGTGESMVVVYGGARGMFDAGPLRVRLVYDFMPFWSGENRLEHRLTGLLAKRPRGGTSYGLRAAFEVGQKRDAAGGLNDAALTLGLEVGL